MDIGGWNMSKKTDIESAGERETNETAAKQPAGRKSDGKQGNMGTETVSTAVHSDGTLFKKILIGIGIACAILVIFLVVLDNSGARYRTEHSKEFGYSVKYDETRYQKDRINLGSIEAPTYMDRIGFKSNPYANFLAVSIVAEDADVNEALEAFQSDGSYSFVTEEDAVFGAGNYRAKKIVYTDNEGEEPLEVTYYYLADRKLFVTVSCDESHKKELAKMLASLELDD